LAGQPAAFAQAGLVSQSDQRPQVHAGAAGAQRQGTVANGKGARGDAMANGVADGIHFTQQAGGGLDQPSNHQSRRSYI